MGLLFSLFSIIFYIFWALLYIEPDSAESQPTWPRQSRVPSPGFNPCLVPHRRSSPSNFRQDEAKRSC